MATRLDELFFELSVRRGAGTEQEISRYTGSMKKAGKATTQTAKDLDRYTASGKRAGKTSGVLGAGLKRLVIAFGGLLILRKVNAAVGKDELFSRRIEKAVGFILFVDLSVKVIVPAIRIIMRNSFVRLPPDGRNRE